jgi:CHAT domain-containing protein
VRFARERLSISSNSSGTPKPLGDLFDLLIKPTIAAGALNGVTRLTIVAEGSLSALPFAALWNNASGRFVIEDYVVRYLPSPAALVSLVEEPGHAPASLTVFAPLPDSLPGTRTEARAIATVFPAVVTLVGPAATEERFRAALMENRAVHVASHGSHNSQNPLFSRMIVGRERSSAPSNDGRLEVHEILGLTTRAPLVFLSGCETAVGSAGEGAFGQGSQEGSLAHAFLIAGATTVVATLWRIDDASAAGLAESFYTYLRRGSAPDQALALAQRQALAKRKDFTWAAYDVFGARSRN